MSIAKFNGAGGRNGAPVLKTETEICADVVQLALRTRFNPLRNLTPSALSSQLDNFQLGLIAYAALTWEAIERRDDVLKGVAAKRKKNVAKLKRESLRREESPEAEAHAEALDEFYDNLSCINALDENEAGGFSLLVRQMMDAVGKYYAVHEIVWQPGEDGTLTAQLRFVPLWFFENRDGRLKFLRIPLGGAMGTPLEEGGWMITKGDGLMEACSVAYMFKNLPLKDWLSYSDKFGTPGVLGQTNAAKGSDSGNAMQAAVASFGQNWSGVVYGADGAIKEPLSLITAKGEGTLPFPPLIERMDRAMVALWRGSDLSTMSADTKGASVQDGESDILLQDDAEMISDTLNLYLDKFIIAQKFGQGTKPLAYSKLIVPQKENVELDLKIDELLLKAGARLGENERLEHYGRPQMNAKDTPLRNPATITEKVADTSTAPIPTGELANERGTATAKGADSPSLGKLLAKSRALFGESLAGDLKPLRTALARVLHGEDDGLLARAQALSAKLNDPDFAGQLIAAKGSSDALFKILSAAAASGLATQSRDESLANGDVTGHEFHGNQHTGGHGSAINDSDFQPSPKPIPTHEAVKRLTAGFEHVGHDGRRYKFGKNLLDKFAGKEDGDFRLRHLPHAQATLSTPFRVDHQANQDMHIGLFRHGDKELHTFVFTGKEGNVTGVSGYYLPRRAQVEREVRAMDGGRKK